MSKNLSAIKRVQISERNNVRNKAYKSAIKTLIRKTLRSLEDVNSDSKLIAKQNLSAAYSKIDKAVSKGIIKKNKAARQKSKLLKQVKERYV